MKSVSTTRWLAPRSSRWYTCTVTALATFLVGLAVWRLPTKEFVSTASLIQRSTATTSGRDPAAEILAPENLRRAIRVLALNAPVSQPYTRSSEEAFVAAVSERIAVDTRESGDSGEQVIVISYRDQGPDRAVAVVDHLAHQYILDRSSQHDVDPIIHEHRLAREVLNEARSGEMVAKKELNEFLVGHFKLLVERRRQTSTSSALTPKPSATSGGTDSMGLDMNAPTFDGSVALRESSPMVVNPQWLKLQRELDRLMTEQGRLLEERTESHPAVIDQSRLIQTVTDSLDREPEMVAGDPSVAQVAEPVVVAPPPSEGSLSKQRLVEYEKFKVLQAAYESAARDCQAAVTAERDTWGGTLSSTCSPVSINHAACITGHVKRSQGSRIGWLSCLALCIGLVCARTTPKINSNPMVHDPGLAGQLLGTPVLGILSEVGPATTARRFDGKSLVRVVTVASELLLALFVFGFLLSAFLENGFAINVIENPLGTIWTAFTSFSMFGS